MQTINFKLLNGGYYALMIDGEEIGVVYKQEHARLIEIATSNIPQLEHRVETLSNENTELTIMNNRLMHKK